MADAICIVMLDTIISLKIVLILILAIFALDEVFLGLQTSETANFFASRASLVDQDIYSVDSFFNNHIFKYFIFTKESPFLHIQNLETQRNDTSHEITTKFHVSTFLHGREFEVINHHGLNELSHIEDIKNHETE